MKQQPDYVYCAFYVSDSYYTAIIHTAIRLAEQYRYSHSSRTERRTYRLVLDGRWWPNSTERTNLQEANASRNELLFTVPSFQGALHWSPTFHRGTEDCGVER